MVDRKVRIDDFVLKKIQKFRRSSAERGVKYPSDKHLVHVAVLKLLEEEENE